MQKISLRKKSFGFIDLCGQLRFQQRWAQSPRVPKTSVLGHMLIVAILSYLCSVEIGACGKRIYNNFFSGLLHDLPEVLTRDIVSPVKQMGGLEEIIKEYEIIHLEERILPLVPSSLREKIVYFVEDEFANRIFVDGVVQKDIPDTDMISRFNEDRFSPVDGEIIKACDKLAAFIEDIPFHQPRDHIQRVGGGENLRLEGLQRERHRWNQLRAALRLLRGDEGLNRSKMTRITC